MEFSDPYSRPLNQYLLYFSTKISYRLSCITSTLACYLPELFPTLEYDFSVCLLFFIICLIGHLLQLHLYPCWWLITLLYSFFSWTFSFFISTLEHPSMCKAAPSDFVQNTLKTLSISSPYMISNYKAQSISPSIIWSYNGFFCTLTLLS